MSSHDERRAVLVIDDRVPARAAGSGYGRMLDTIEALLAGGYDVTLHPTGAAPGDPGPLMALGARVGGGDLRQHLSRAKTAYGAAIVTRPNNAGWIRILRRLQPRCAIVYDAEALFSRRLWREAEIVKDADPVRAARASELARRVELLEAEIVRRCDLVVCISRDEAAVVKAVPGHAPVHLIEPITGRALMTTPGFNQRHGMIFVASWAAGYPSPNTDGLEWFLANVLPLVRDQVAGAGLRVTGSGPPAALTGRGDPGVEFVGEIPDLEILYASARVVVVPIRYGAGVKIKAIEALEHGVPVVATLVGAEGIDTRGHAVMAVGENPDTFAQSVATLLLDPVAWESARAAIHRLHLDWQAGRDHPWHEALEAARTIRAGRLARAEPTSRLRILLHAVVGRQADRLLALLGRLPRVRWYAQRANHAWGLWRAGLPPRTYRLRKR